MLLYPLKFKPIYKEKIWGGNKLKEKFNKKDAPKNCGESWEISSVKDNVSIVENGFLAGNTLEELLEVYMGDLVGEKVYETFGNEFPLLVKFIDATNDLSIQVHPNNEVAKERHNAYGKSEMWYILDANKNSKIINGFIKDTNKEDFFKFLKDSNNNVEDLSKLINFQNVNYGDVIFIPAGRLHSLGADTLIAEIQQSSDITYRVYDWERKDLDGKMRELHTELAKDVIDYSKIKKQKIDFEKLPDRSNKIFNHKLFSVNTITLLNILERDYVNIDSFVIYMCIIGSVEVKTLGGNITLKKGECVLIPAEITEVRIEPENYSELLEIFIDLKPDEKPLD